MVPNSASPLWNHVLFTLPTSFSPLPTRMYCLLYRKTTWFINSHATVTVAMYAVLPKGCRIESNNMFPNLSALALLPKNAYFFARRCESSTQTNTQSLASDSAIGHHLLQSPTCAQHYDDSRCSVLGQGRSSFHLSALEVTFIKTSNPAFCDKKEFVYSLKIVH